MDFTIERVVFEYEWKEEVGYSTSDTDFFLFNAKTKTVHYKKFTAVVDAITNELLEGEKHPPIDYMSHFRAKICAHITADGTPSMFKELYEHLDNILSMHYTATPKFNFTFNGYSLNGCIPYEWNEQTKSGILLIDFISKE